MVTSRSYFSEKTLVIINELEGFDMDTNRHKKMYDVKELKKHLNKPIKLSTIDGKSFDGILGHVDEQNIHIVVPINIGPNKIENIGSDHVGDIEQHSHSERDQGGRGYNMGVPYGYGTEYRSPSEVGYGMDYGYPSNGYGYQTPGDYPNSGGYYNGGYQNPYGFENREQSYYPYYYNQYPQPTFYNESVFPQQNDEAETDSRALPSYFGQLTLPIASLANLTEIN